MSSENAPLLTTEHQPPGYDEASVYGPRERRNSRIRKFQIILALISVIMVTTNFVLSIIDVVKYKEHGVITGLMGTSLGGFAILYAFFVYYRRKGMIEISGWFFILFAVVLNLEAAFISIQFIRGN